MQEHDVSKITGAPPGYVGFEDSEPVTERIRRQPYCVLLLDEIEKAHPKVIDKFLAILNDGKITDNHGSTVLFNNVIILMTTNLGAKEVQKLIENKGKSGIGWGDKSDQSPEKLQDGLGELYKKARESYFRPEMLGRIEGNGGIITFRPLDQKDIAQIAVIELGKVNKRLTAADRANLPGVTLELSEEAMQQVVTEGYNPTLGARAVLKVMQEKISGPLGKWLMQHRDEVESLLSREGSAKIVIKDLGRDAKGWPTVAPVLVGPTPSAPVVVNDNALPKALPPKRPAVPAQP
jgi:ATP-dependent Clp protease ATP-binding subunit ClpA